MHVVAKHFESSCEASATVVHMNNPVFLHLILLTFIYLVYSVAFQVWTGMKSQPAGTTSSLSTIRAKVCRLRKLEYGSAHCKLGFEKREFESLAEYGAKHAF